MAQNTPSAHTARLTWDEQGQPISLAFDDVYFSRDNGLEETNYVFLRHNNLPQRWIDSTPLEQSNNIFPASATFTIAETGFGSGLNFLVTWQQWLTHARQGNYQHLHFISVEKYPLSRIDLSRALQLWPELNELAKQLIDAYPPQPAVGIHRLRFKQAETSVTLTLYFGDAAEGFHDMQPTKLEDKKTQFGAPFQPIDAWFLDGFSPAKNPGMWTDELFHALANMSGSQTTFATFTAAGLVKRSLQAAGFHCQKSKGFGRKREMLFGSYSKDRFNTDQSSLATNETTSTVKPSVKSRESSHLWYLHQAALFSSTRSLLNEPDKRNLQTHIVIIGGGLAGCHTAFALAEKGFDITIVEKQSELATQASGNRQGVVYTRLSPFQDPLSRFNMAAQLFADQFYQQHHFYENCGGQTGVLHLPMNERQTQLYRELSGIYASQPEFIQWIEQQQTKNCTGIEFNRGGLLLPKAGWLDPNDLCKRLANHIRIKKLHNTSIKNIKFENDQWTATTENGQQLLSSHIIICNAHDAMKLAACSELPLKRIRGQVTHLPATTTSLKLKVTVCGEGYIAPAMQRLNERHPVHGLGASFNLKDNNPELTREDHLDNLQKLSDIAPELKNEMETTEVSCLNGKVGFRTTTPDYFPIAGPMPNYQKMEADFGDLRKKANKRIDNTGSVQKNLYCNLALGSRGLAYAPLTAELLASLICGNTLPMTSDLYKHLHPARFFIRDLQRNKR